MTILGPDGKPTEKNLRLEEDECPRCRSLETEVYRGFGGHWTRVCSTCGCSVAHGQDRRDTDGLLLDDEVRS